MTTPTTAETRSAPSLTVWRVVVAYVLFAGLWIVSSETALYWLIGDPVERAWLLPFRGAGLVAITAVLLYLLLTRMMSRQQQAFDAERQALAAREQTLSLLYALANCSPDAIYVKDVLGRYLLINRGAARAIGQSAEAMIDQDDRAAFPLEQAEAIRANDQRVMTLDRAETFEEELDTTGGLVTYLATKGPLRDVSGQVIGVYGISRDITERQLAQKKLADSENQYRLLFESNPHTMALFDARSRYFLAVNQAAVTKYGYSRTEFMHMRPDDLHTATSRERWDALVHAQPADGLLPVQNTSQWQHQCKGGGVIDVEVTTCVVEFRGQPAFLGLAVDITERLALEREKQQQQVRAEAAHQLLSKVLTRVRDGFVALDRDWRYTYLNQQAARLLGRQGPEDLLGRNVWAEFPQSRGQPFALVYERAMQTQQPEVFEEHYKPWDRWFESRVYPSDEGLSIYFTDITQRKEAEAALRLSEQRYRLAAAHGQVWDWDEQTRQLHVAPEFSRQLGYEPSGPEDALVDLERRMHPLDRSRRRRGLWRHLIHREPYDVEFRVQHADGTWRWFHSLGQAVWDAQGRATFMAGTTVDITLRKQAEEARREAETYLRSLFEQLSDGVVLHGPDLEILEANAHALAMLGYSRGELLALKATDLLVDYERQRLIDGVRTMGKTDVRLAEWEMRRRDGSQFPAEISARQLDATRTLAVLRDISARREAQSALVAHQIELSELTQQLLTQERQTMQRLAQSLHDRLGQTLAVARLNLDATAARAAPLLTAEIKAMCDRQGALLDQAVLEVRHVLHELRPPLLEEQGLAAALDNEIRLRLAPLQSPDLLLEVDDDVAACRWPSDVEYGAFMVAREAIANAVRHARASLVRVSLQGSATTIRLDVGDDGAGIATPQMRGRPGHLGIVGMRERALAIGAGFVIVPGAEGGTTVQLRWKARAT